MPKSRSTTKRTLRTLGLDYKSIHAFPNDHVLFRKYLANETKCPKCHSSHNKEDIQGDRIPHKVLRHFPLVLHIKTYV